jgi:hypothetical protein
MRFIFAVSCFVLSAAPLCAAGAAKKPVAKPPAKTTKPANKPVAKPAIKGTAQMAGDQAVPGTTYTLSKGESALNFTLDSTEFRVERVLIGGETIAPKADEKLLLLKYTVQNPNKTPLSYDWGTLKFTAVDLQNTNREAAPHVGNAATKDKLFIELKPAQKIAAYAAIAVPAKGVVPKLIVQHHDGGPVLRYDLRTVVKGLEAPYAGTDKSTALPEVKGESGQFYPLLDFDVKLVSTAYVATPLGEHELEEGQRFFVATITLKNQSAIPALYDWGTLLPSLITADDEKNEFSGIMLKTARNEGAHGELKPGQEYTGRLLFRIPKDIAAKTLHLSQPESRVYSFDVSGTK